MIDLFAQAFVPYAPANLLARTRGVVALLSRNDAVEKEPPIRN
jgi:uncharacterized RmlC-like cupin family protein